MGQVELALVFSMNPVAARMLCHSIFWNDVLIFFWFKPLHMGVTGWVARALESLFDRPQSRRSSKCCAQVHGFPEACFMGCPASCRTNFMSRWQAGRPGPASNHCVRTKLGDAGSNGRTDMDRKSPAPWMSFCAEAGGKLSRKRKGCAEVNSMQLNISI